VSYNSFSSHSLAPLTITPATTPNTHYVTHALEVQAVQGRKVKMSIWVRSMCLPFLPSRPKGQMVRCFFFLSLHPSLVLYIIVGHCRPRTFLDYHCIVLPRSTRGHTRYEYSPRYVSLLRGLTAMHCISVRCVESRIVRGAPAMARRA
jgi:hypothetical protein